MKPLDITFDAEEAEVAVSGGVVSAAQVLARFEGEDEQALEDYLQSLEEQGIVLDLLELPPVPASGDTAVRLRMEAELAASGDLLKGLEENDPLGLYLQELAQIPAAGDPQVLAMELLEGKDVRERLVNVMLSRVVEAACKLAGRGVLLLDLIQEGSLGLWQGILYYAGGDIYAHCDYWIAQYMAKLVTLQARAVGVGIKLRQGMADFVDVDRRLLAELGRNPTLEEIAEELHVELQEAAVYQAMVRSAQSKAPAEEEENPEEEEQHVEDTAYFQTRQAVEALLSGLSADEAKLLSLRYGLEGGLPLSPGEAGLKLGMTPSEVLEKEAAILAKLRN